MEICEPSLCTGCGMCADLCPKSAVKMKEKEHGFLFPEIDDRCVNCGLCTASCPANKEYTKENTVRKIYAAWNKDKRTKKRSTSGGIFSLLAQEIVNNGGLAAGVKWNEKFETEFAIAKNTEEIKLFNGSKYLQSKTGNIYKDVESALNNGRQVLFSGTPCQVAALKSFLKKDYDNLFTVDIVCHGVPSYGCFEKYLKERKAADGKREVSKVNLRYKNPYWDYCSVRIDYSDGGKYQQFTTDDPYFSLFNVGYTLRESCHSCPYTSMNRQGDITLGDFWCYTPKSFKMRNYNKGVSLVLVNSEKGEKLYSKVCDRLNFCSESVAAAKKSNITLSRPFELPNDELKSFWQDYDSGITTEMLFKKYVKTPLKVPSLMFLRRLKYKYSWVVKRK